MKKATAKRGFTLIEIMLVVGVIGMLCTMAIPAFVKARTNSQESVCISNLRQVHSAKEQWAMINNKPDGASVELTVPPRTKKALQRPADAEEGSEGGSGSGQQ